MLAMLMTLNLNKVRTGILIQEWQTISPTIWISSPNSKGISTINHIPPATTSFNTSTTPNCNSHIDIWHTILGHLSSPLIDKVFNNYTPHIQINEKLSFCQVCAIGKSHSIPFSPSSTIYTPPLQWVVSDL